MCHQHLDVCLDFVNTVIPIPILILSTTIMLVLFYLHNLLRHFIKRDVQVDVSPVQLVKLDVTGEKLWVSPKQVDIGMCNTTYMFCYRQLLGSAKGAAWGLMKLKHKFECTVVNIKYI